MAADGNVFAEELQFLKGVGPKRAEFLRKLGLTNCRDLLHFYPRRYLDHSTVAKVISLRSGQAVTVVGRVAAASRVSGRRPRFEAHVIDDWNGRITMIWFNSLSWIERALKKGERAAFHGTVRLYGGRWSIIHPDFDRLDEGGPQLSTGRILALYPGGQKYERFGLTSKRFRKIIYGLIRNRGLEFPDQVLPSWIVDRYTLMDGRQALRAVHFPKSQAELNGARTRLKFEELFFVQLMLRYIHSRRGERRGIVVEDRSDRTRRFLEEVLPFELTGGQKQALDRIAADMRSGMQMHRLLQGDVGCGKTVVAVAALLMAIDSGYQGAFMAPTEVLAEQQYHSLVRYLEPLDVNVRFLVGGQATRLRSEILQELANGQCHIVVGTHAVIQEMVTFQRLAIAVVDEQHRFGVTQRAQLFAKGDRPHTLLMTATPIPRSLALTVYGDLDVTTIREMPKGRKPIVTRLLNAKRRGEMHALVYKQLKAGRQVYVVYPQVAESEKTDLKDAENGFAEWQRLCPEHHVGLVHGQMPSAAKEEVMARFKSGDVRLLVATTVIEVGVDTPNATVMVIEHAERFGLSQLHQLRGRVGRSTQQSYCVLMAEYRQSAEARERLRVMVKTTDGFKISDADLKLRGTGDIFGTRQSGLPELRIADVAEDMHLIERSQQAARDLWDRDPELTEPEHRQMKWYFETFIASRLEGFARAG